MNVRLTPAAKADLRAARSWYRDRQVGLDARFLAAFDIVVRNIEEHPKVGPVVYGELRRVLLDGFPYAAFYMLRQSEAIVVACMHGARDPRRWQARGAD